MYAQLHYGQVDLQSITSTHVKPYGLHFSAWDHSSVIWPLSQINVTYFEVYSQPKHNFSWHTEDKIQGTSTVSVLGDRHPQSLVFYILYYSPTLQSEWPIQF